MSKIKYLAIHLPQFHPIPENDKWWGNGFTEWRNVAKAKPLYWGHYQPRLPADLGFYDLRLPEAREAQAQMAKEYGIDGFCYYHYWFRGKRLLERPFNEIIASGKPNFPFCLFWANETWEGRWHGIAKEENVLIKQEYSEEDDLNHIRWLAKVMADKRYICIEGRPIFLIYKPLDLPNPEKTIEIWRNEFRRLGISNPYLIGSTLTASIKELFAIGCDGVLTHLPRIHILDEFLFSKKMKEKGKRFIRNLKQGVFSYKLNLFDYEASVKKMLIDDFEGPVYRCLMPSWDNTPRAGECGVVLTGSTPEKFEKFLNNLTNQTIERFPADRQILFLNAWNEWAEGNYLEPDLKYGNAYLKIIRKTKEKFLNA